VRGRLVFGVIAAVLFAVCVVLVSDASAIPLPCPTSKWCQIFWCC
jgi:hypothetical protein